MEENKMNGLGLFSDTVQEVKYELEHPDSVSNHYLTKEL